jgi:NAD(P)-dependent dehydrogenase (short-subunit alcohol dehydrogenase family)
MKKVAVITGTTSGLGEMIASYYKHEDYHVFGINRVDFPVNRFSVIHKNIVCDLEYANEREDAIDYDGQIDVLINNAGAMRIPEIDFNCDIQPTVNLNLIAAMHLCQLVDPLLSKESHIINIASVSGIIGDTDAPIYSAAKAGIINFTRSLAKMLAPQTRVNCISPGFFATNLVEGDAPQELIDEVPMKREAKPHEIIPVVDMLQKSTYMTGANIVIDGGLSL